MDFKSKLLFSLLFTLILLSIAASAYRFIILRDYEIYWDDYGEVADDYSIENSYQFNSLGDTI